MPKLLPTDAVKGNKFWVVNNELHGPTAHMTPHQYFQTGDPKIDGLFQQVYPNRADAFKAAAKASVANAGTRLVARSLTLNSADMQRYRRTF